MSSGCKGDIMRLALSAQIFLGVLVSFVGSDLATGQNYPTKAIRIIVPAGPRRRKRHHRAHDRPEDTGTAGTIGRHRQPHRGGRADRRRARCEVAADGYTLLLGNVATQAIIPNVQPNVAYSPLKDFQPVSLIASASVAGRGASFAAGAFGQAVDRLRQGPPWRIELCRPTASAARRSSRPSSSS
jgi:hypothetical protein